VLRAAAQTRRRKRKEQEKNEGNNFVNETLD
jgi:hypothetical protein